MNSFSEQVEGIARLQPVNSTYEKTIQNYMENILDA
jgi:hypothetical protein